MRKFVFALTTLLATMGAAQAQAPAATPMRFLGGLGLSAGGDELATAEYTNGSSQDIKAGGGFYFTAGADYRLSEQFSLQGTLNFHVDDTNARNGSIKFQRFPIELLGYYHINEQWRIGAGVRYLSGAKLSSSGAAAGLHAKFDSTVSGVAEVEYFWAPNFGMKMRYVSEKLEAPRIREVNANHFGISGNFYF